MLEIVYNAEVQSCAHCGAEDRTGLALCINAECVVALCERCANAICAEIVSGQISRQLDAHVPTVGAMTTAELHAHASNAVCHAVGTLLRPALELVPLVVSLEALTNLLVSTGLGNGVSKEQMHQAISTAIDDIAMERLVEIKPEPRGADA